MAVFKSVSLSRVFKSCHLPLSAAHPICSAGCPTLPSVCLLFTTVYPPLSVSKWDLMLLNNSGINNSIIVKCPPYALKVDRPITAERQLSLYTLFNHNQGRIAPRLKNTCKNFSSNIYIHLIGKLLNISFSLFSNIYSVIHIVCAFTKCWIKINIQ